MNKVSYSRRIETVATVKVKTAFIRKHEVFTDSDSHRHTQTQGAQFNTDFKSTIGSHTLHFLLHHLQQPLRVRLQQRRSPAVLQLTAGDAATRLPQHLLHVRANYVKRLQHR